MGGGEHISSSSGCKASPRPSSPEVGRAEAPSSPMGSSDPLPSERDLRLGDEDLPDFKATARTSSPELSRVEAPSTPNLKAAGSAPGPYSRDLVAMAAREEQDLLAMASREERDLVPPDWEEVIQRDMAMAARARADDWEASSSNSTAGASANPKVAGSAPDSRDLVPADWGEVLARDMAISAMEDPSWPDDWEHSVDPAPSSSISTTAKGKVAGSSVYLAVAPTPLLASGDESYSYGSRYWPPAAKGLAGLDYSCRPNREKVRSRVRRRLLAPSPLLPLPSGEGSYSRGSRAGSFSEPILPDTVPETVLSSGYLAPSPLLPLPSGEGSYSCGSRAGSFSEPILPDTMPGTVLSSGYLAPSPLAPSGEGSYDYDSQVDSFFDPSLSDTVPGTIPSSGYMTPSPFMSRFEESKDALDKGYVYFKHLVEKFIAMAYPQGMHGAPATGSSQQEDTTFPSASACSMETKTAREVTNLEGARSGKSVRRRMVTHERWTWRNQRIGDGLYALIVMSPTIEQIIKDSCTPTATKAVLESNLRVQHNENSVLSLKHLNKLYKDSAAKHPDEAGIARMFSILESEGVLSETDFENPPNAGAARYHITYFRHYNVDHPEFMKFALLKLREGGPLMGVINISENYKRCACNGEIYKYDPDQELEEDGKPMKLTHAICIISFGIEGEGKPYLEGHNSHGEEKFKPYLKIDISSLCQLWSIECERRERTDGSGRYPLPRVRRAPQVPLGSESAVPGKNTTVLSIPGSSDRIVGKRSVHIRPVV